MNLSALFAATPSIGAAVSAEQVPAGAVEGGDAAALAAVFRSLVESLAGSAAPAPAREHADAATSGLGPRERDEAAVDAAGTASDDPDQAAELPLSVPVASDTWPLPAIQPEIRVAVTAPAEQPDETMPDGADGAPLSGAPGTSASGTPIAVAPSHARVPHAIEATPEHAITPATPRAMTVIDIPAPPPAAALSTLPKDMPGPAVDTYSAAPTMTAADTPTAETPRATGAFEEAPAKRAAHDVDVDHRAAFERRDAASVRELVGHNRRPVVATAFAAARAAAPMGRSCETAAEPSVRESASAKSADRLTASIARSCAAAGAEQTSAPFPSSPSAATPGPVLHQSAAAGVNGGPANTTVAPQSALPESTAAQIVHSIRMQAMQSGGDARIRLEPGQFGEVTIAVRVRNGEVTASVRAESPVVREWLQGHQALLRDGLADQNLVLSKLEVSEPHAEPRDSSAHRDGGSRDAQQEREANRRRQPRAPHTFSESFEDVA